MGFAIAYLQGNKRSDTNVTKCNKTVTAKAKPAESNLSKCTLQTLRSMLWKIMANTAAVRFKVTENPFTPSDAVRLFHTEGQHSMFPMVDTLDWLKVTETKPLVCGW